MNTVCFSINPGARAQELHRDDWAYHQINPATEIFTERETSLGLFIAGKPVNEQKRRHALPSWLAPVGTWGGAHRRADRFRRTRSGRCIHYVWVMLPWGWGANTTNDEERLLFSCFSTRGWLRQENYYLNVPLDIAKKMPTALQKFIGYDISEPFLG
jgi:hypothetical protein